MFGSITQHVHFHYSITHLIDVMTRVMQIYLLNVVRRKTGRSFNEGPHYYLIAV